MTRADALILRGLHLLLRTTFMPSDQVRQVQAVTQLQADIGPWLGDYASIMQDELPALEDEKHDFEKDGEIGH